MKLMKLAVLSAAIVAAPTASVQAKGFGAELLGARAQSEWGGELGIGYGVQVGPFAIRPIAGAFVHKGDNDRYERDTFSNGQSRCRDYQTGQFASDSKCTNIGVDWYAKAELAYVATSDLELGGGARFSSEKVRPYGTAAIRLNQTVKLKGNAGPHYFALGITGGF